MRAEEFFEKALPLAPLFLLASCRRVGKGEKEAVLFAFYGNPLQVHLLQGQLAAFHKVCPEVKVRPIHIPSRYYTKLTIMLASGEPPDLFFVSASDIPRLASKGALLPLSALLGRSQNVKEETFLPFALKWMRFDGRVWGKGEIYALPKHFGPANLVFLNLDFLDESSLCPPKPGWNWQDFLRLMKLLKRALERKGNGYFAGAIYYLPYLLVEALYQAGFPQRPLDSPECVEVLSKVLAPFREGLLLTSEGLEGQMASDLFISRRVGLLLSGSWELLKLLKEKALRWTFLPLPKVGPLNVRVSEGPIGYAISSKSSRRKEAWALLEFLSSFEGAKFDAEAGWGLPTRLDLLRKLKGEKAKVALLFLEGRFEIRPVPSSPSVPATKFLTVLRKEVEAFLAGRKGLREALALTVRRLKEQAFHRVEGRWS